MIQCEQEHEFQYLLKKDGNDYSIQVLEIPGIIIGGQDVKTIQKELSRAAKHYLDNNDNIHSKAQCKTLSSSLKTSQYGIVLGIEKFIVKC